MYNIAKKIFFLMLFISSFCYPAISENDSFISNDNTYVKIENDRYIDENGEFKVRVFDKVDVTDFDVPNCSEVPLSFEKCLTSVCKDLSPFGIMYRKIVGKTDDNSCHYTEKNNALWWHRLLIS